MYNPCALRCFSCVWLFVTQWTIAWQYPLSMGDAQQEYWSGLPFPPLGIFPTQGLNPWLLHLLHGRQILDLLSHWGSLYDPYFQVYLCLSHYLFSTISHHVGWHMI